MPPASAQSAPSTDSAGDVPQSLPPPELKAAADAMPHVYNVIPFHPPELKAAGVPPVESAPAPAQPPPPTTVTPTDPPKSPEDGISQLLAPVPTPQAPDNPEDHITPTAQSLNAQANNPLSIPADANRAIIQNALASGPQPPQIPQPPADPIPPTPKDGGFPPPELAKPIASSQAAQDQEGFPPPELAGHPQEIKDQTDLNQGPEFQQAQESKRLDDLIKPYDDDPDKIAAAFKTHQIENLQDAQVMMLHAQSKAQMDASGGLKTPADQEEFQADWQKTVQDAQNATNWLGKTLSSWRDAFLHAPVQIPGQLFGTAENIANIIAPSDTVKGQEPRPDASQAEQAGISAALSPAEAGGGAPVQPTYDNSKTSPEAQARQTVTSINRERTERALVAGLEEGTAEHSEWAENAASHLIGLSSSAPNAMLKLFGGPEIGYIDPKVQVMMASRGAPIRSDKAYMDMDPNQMAGQLFTDRMQTGLHAQRSQGWVGQGSQDMLNAFAGRTVDTPEGYAAKGFPVPLKAIQDTAATANLGEGMLSLGLVGRLADAAGISSILNTTVQNTLKGTAGYLETGAQRLSEAQLPPAVAKVAKSVVDRATSAVAAHFIGQQLGIPAPYAAVIGSMWKMPVADFGIDMLGAGAGLVSKATTALASHAADALKLAADDPDNLLATRGAAKQILTLGIRRATEGVTGIAPALLGAKTPEDVGSLLGMGTSLGMVAHAVPDLAGVLQNRIADSAFVTDTNWGQSRKPADPPTPYGTNKALDQAHEEAINSLDPATGKPSFSNAQKHIINQTRDQSNGMSEIYVLNPKPYAAELQRMQGLGWMNDPVMNSRGVAIDPNPEQNQARVLVRADAFNDAFHHELAHPIISRMELGNPDDLSTFFQAYSRTNDPNDFTTDYTGRATLGRQSSTYDELPSQTEINNGTGQYVPGLRGMTKEDMQREMATEALSGLLKGGSIRDLTRDPTMFHQTQQAFWRVLDGMGIDPTTSRSNTALGLRQSIQAAMVLEPMVRDTLRRNLGQGAGAPPVIDRPNPSARPESGSKPQAGATTEGSSGPTPVPPTPEGAPQGSAPTLEAQTPKPQKPGPNVNPADVVKGLTGIGWTKEDAAKAAQTTAGETWEQVVRNAVDNLRDQKTAAKSKGKSTPADIAKQSLMSEKGFTPEEAERHVPNDTTDAVEAIRNAVKAKAAEAPQEGTGTSGLTMQVKDAHGNVIGESTATKGRSTARVTVKEMMDAGGDSAALAQEAIDNGWRPEDPMPKKGEKRVPEEEPPGAITKKVQDWLGSLTPQERKAVDFWLAGRPEIRAGTHPMSADWESAISRAPFFNGTVFRGLEKLSDADVDKLRQIGLLHENPYDSSASTGHEIAKNFSRITFINEDGEPQEGHSVVLEVNGQHRAINPEGSLDIRTGVPYQREVILPKGANYITKEFRENYYGPNQHHVVLDQVPEDAATPKESTTLSKHQEALTEPPREETKQASSTSLENIGQAGSAISKNMRDMLWGKFQKGDTTEAGGPSNLLTLAAFGKKAGRINTRQEFEDFVTRYGESLKANQQINAFARSEEDRTPKQETAKEAPKETPETPKTGTPEEPKLGIPVPPVPQQSGPAPPTPSPHAGHVPVPLTANVPPPPPVTTPPVPNISTSTTVVPQVEPEQQQKTAETPKENPEDETIEQREAREQPAETTKGSAPVQKHLREQGKSAGHAQREVHHALRGEATPPLAHHGAGNIGFYGYAGDTSWDHGSLRGVGAFPHVSKPGSLVPGYSAGLTKEGAAMRGVRPGQEFVAEDGKTYRYDDTAPTDFDFQGKHHHVPADYVDVYSPMHEPDEGMSAEQIAANQAYMAQFGIGSNGQRGPISVGEAAVEHATGVPPPPAKETPQVPTTPKAEESLPKAPEPVTAESIKTAEDAAHEATVQGARQSDEAYTAAIQKQVLQTVGEQHAASLAPDDQRVRYDASTGNLVGKYFDPTDPFHQWLLNGTSQQAQHVIKAIQGSIQSGQDLWIDYNSAPQQAKGTATASQRAEAQAESEARDRAKGIAPSQQAGKNIIPSYVGASLGKKGEPNSLYYGGVSPDKVASNASQIVQRLGPESPYKAGPAGDPVAEEDMRGYLHNVSNGWKGDGSAKLKPTPGANLPMESPGFTPYTFGDNPAVAKAKSNFWNLAVQGKGAGLSEAEMMNPETSSGRARAMALGNEGYVSGETKPPKEVARAVAAGRAQQLDEAQERRDAELENQAHKFDVLKSIQDHGGLPTAKRNAQLATSAGGMSYPKGEIADLHDAWKSLDKDSKAYLKKHYGINAGDLFTASADHPDKLNARVSQTSEVPYDNPGDLIAGAHDALAEMSKHQMPEVKSSGVRPGLTNPLHAKIEAETPGWTKETLHSGYERLLADNTVDILPSGEEASEQIHPGHEAVARALQEGGYPPAAILKAGFMPGETPKTEASAPSEAEHGMLAYASNPDILRPEERLKKNAQLRANLEKQQAKLDTTKPEEDKQWDEMAKRIRDLENEHQQGTENLNRGGALFMPDAKSADLKDLVAMHNTSEEGIAHAARLGGFPVPSLAVTKKSIPFNSFGDYTLIAHPDVVDPERGTHVFDRDTYTKTQPTIKSTWDKKKAEQIIAKEIKPASAKVDGQGPDSSNLYQFRDALDKRVNSIGQEAYYNDTARIAYLDSIGKLPPIEHEPLNRSSIANTPGVKEGVESLTPEEREQLGEYRTSEVPLEKVRDRVAQEARQFYEAKGLTEDQMKSLIDTHRESIGWGNIRHYLDNLNRNETKMTNASDDAIRKAVEENGGSKAIQKYLDDLFEPARKDTYFDGPRGKKMDYNLRNLTEAMSGGPIRGAQKTMVEGLGKAAATGAHRIGSIQEMHNRSEWILTDPEKTKSYNDDTQEQYFHALDPLPFDQGGQWEKLDAGSKAIAQYKKGPRTTAGMQNALFRQGFGKADGYSLDAMKQVADRVHNAQTDYFEAKPQRAVKLNEFTAAVVPQDVKPETEKLLKDNGINTIEKYDRSQNNAPELRRQAVEKASEQAKAQFMPSKRSRTPGEPTLDEFKDSVEKGRLHSATGNFTPEERNARNPVESGRLAGYPEYEKEEPRPDHEIPSTSLGKLYRSFNEMPKEDQAKYPKADYSGTMVPVESWDVPNHGKGYHPSATQKVRGAFNTETGQLEKAKGEFKNPVTAKEMQEASANIRSAWNDPARRMDRGVDFPADREAQYRSVMAERPESLGGPVGFKQAQGVPELPRLLKPGESTENAEHREFGFQNEPFRLTGETLPQVPIKTPETPAEDTRQMSMFMPGDVVEGPGGKRERIKAAAVRVNGEHVYTGFNHNHAEEQIPRSMKVNSIEYGFTTNSGKYLDRDSGWEVAKKARQIVPDNERTGEQNAAEDILMDEHNQHRLPKTSGPSPRTGPEAFDSKLGSAAFMPGDKFENDLGEEETIRAAAIRSGGKIYTGPNHSDALDKLLEDNPKAVYDPNDAGYVTTGDETHPQGRFLDRREAWDLAKKVGQLRKSDLRQRYLLAEDTRGLGYGDKKTLFMPSERIVEHPENPQVKTPEFQKWFKGSKVTDQNGDPLRLYHGTTQDFDTHDPESKGSAFSDWGKGIYMSNNPEDASENYTGTGEEYQGREHGGHASIQPLYASLKYPVEIGGPAPTRWTSADLHDYREAVRDVFDRHDIPDAEEAIDRSLRTLKPGDQPYAQDVIDRLKNSTNIKHGAVVSDVLKQMGHDGIIDHEPFEKWGGDEYQKGMPGLTYDTTHVIAFDPENVKSATGNRGTFSQRSGNVNFMPGAPDVVTKGANGNNVRETSDYEKGTSGDEMVRYRSEGVPPGTPQEQEPSVPINGHGPMDAYTGHVHYLPPDKMPAEERSSLIDTPDRIAKIGHAQAMARQWLADNPMPKLSATYSQSRLPKDADMKVEDLGDWIEGKNKNLDLKDPTVRTQMARAVTYDIMKRLSQDGSGLDWYDAIPDAAVKYVADHLDPSINANDENRTMYRLALATTSNGQNVYNNAETAYHAFQYFKQHDELPTDKKDFVGGGVKINSMIDTFKMLNDLRKDLGGTKALEDLLNKKMTVREMRDMDLDIGGEAPDYSTHAALALGPKIGSFYSALGKHFEHLVMDMWFKRTMNRMVGDMFKFSPTAFQSQIGSLSRSIKSGEVEMPDEQKSAILSEIGNLQGRDDLTRRQAVEESPELQKWVHDTHKEFAKAIVDPDGTSRSYPVEKRNPINYLSKNIDEGLHKTNDSPAQAERPLYREIMEKVLKNLKKSGIDMHMADAQAIAWFVEQSLYKDAGAANKGSDTSDYLDGAYSLVAQQREHPGRPATTAPKVPKLPKATKKALPMLAPASL